MLGLVLPLYDEAAGVEAVVRALHGAFEEAAEPLRLVLVNNGSRDGTGPIVDRLAAELGCVALHLPQNAGYGGGILAGLALLDTERVGWAWGDGQVAPNEVLAVARLARQHPEALCKARRVRREDGLRRALNSRIYNRTMRGLFGVGTADVNGCPKVLRRALLTRLGLQARDWWLDAECVLRAQALGVPLVEVDVVMGPRRAGRSKVRWTTSLAFAARMARWRWEGPGPARPPGP